MSVWRRALVGLVTVLAMTSHLIAQNDSCTLHYEAYSGGSSASVPDASGDLYLAFDVDAQDGLAEADAFDDVIPPFAPPGGWFVALSNPTDAGLFWGRADGRLLDPAPGTNAAFFLRLHPRFSETAVDSVELNWSGSCFTPPNVTVLSMASCDSTQFIVPDMTAQTSAGLGRGSSTVWDDEEFCLAVGIKDDLLASVKMYLEGPYDSGKMSVPEAYEAHIPLSQPYSNILFDGSVLDYDGLETTASLPDSSIDWVLVALRTDVTAGSTVPESEHAAILLANGTLVEADGSTLRFPGVAPAGYHLVARHRNHISVMSADTVDMSDGTGTWDFTADLAHAYTDGPAPMKALPSGVFGLFAGDGSVDDRVTAPDFNLYNAATTAGETGYRPSDYNLDGLVTAPDFNIYNANTTAGAASRVPE